MAKKTVEAPESKVTPKIVKSNKRGRSQISNTESTASGKKLTEKKLDSFFAKAQPPAKRMHK